MAKDMEGFPKGHVASSLSDAAGQSMLKIIPGREPHVCLSNTATPWITFDLKGPRKTAFWTAACLIDIEKNPPPGMNGAQAKALWQAATVADDIPAKYPKEISTTPRMLLIDGDYGDALRIERCGALVQIEPNARPRSTMTFCGFGPLVDSKPSIETVQIDTWEEATERLTTRSRAMDLEQVRTATLHGYDNEPDTC